MISGHLNVDRRILPSLGQLNGRTTICLLVVVVIRLLAASRGSGRPSVIRYSTYAPIVYLASPLFDDLARVALRHKEDTVTRSTTLESRSVRHRGQI